MTKWIDFYEAPYAEDDTLLNNFVEDTLRRVSWKLFENQKEVVYMADETDSGIPRMKEDIIEVIYRAVTSELGWLRDYMVSRILVSYLKGNIESNDEVDWFFKDDLDPEDYAEFRKEIDKHIWDDYAKHLGETRTAQLWEKWGKTSLEVE